MKILFVQNFFGAGLAGGTEILCRDIANGLRDCGHEVMVLCATPGNEPTIRTLGRLHQVRKVNEVESLQKLRARLEWLVVSRSNYSITRKCIRQFNPDMVYLHNLEWVTTSPLKASLDAGKRVVVHAHNRYYHGLWQRQEKMNFHFKDILFKTGLPKQPAEVIATSSQIAESLREATRLKKERIHLVYNGIPSAVFIPIDYRRQRPLRAIFAGAISEHKGVHVAIEAVGEARRNGLALRLDIFGRCGNPAYEEHCRNIILREESYRILLPSGDSCQEQLCLGNYRIECFFCSPRYGRSHSV